MFSNFRKAFITRPQFTAKTPDVILKKASEDLPEGFRYEEIPEHPGFLRITSDDDMTIESSSIKLPADISKIFPDKDSITLAELYNYCYNSQKAVELLPDEDGMFVINGKKINCNKFVSAPLKNTKFCNGRLILPPSPFPAPHPVQVSGNGKTITVMVKRQPNNDPNIQRYCSDGSSGLKVEYSLDPARPEETMNINISTVRVASASKMLESREMINAAFAGKCTIAGMLISIKPTDINKKISEEAIKFFRKAVDVENALSVHFDMTEEIDTHVMQYMSWLYRCFVEGRPFKKYRDVVELKGVGMLGDETVSQYQGKELMVEFVKKYILEFCGIKLELFALTQTYDGLVSEIEMSEEDAQGAFTIKLVSADGKKLYSSYMIFLSNEDLEKFKSEKDYMAIMKLAEELPS